MTHAALAVSATSSGAGEQLAFTKKLLYPMEMDPAFDPFLTTMYRKASTARNPHKHKQESHCTATHT